MAINGGLGRRLTRAFFLQSAVIAIAAILGVRAAAFIIEDVLIQQALEDEAAYFWDLYDQDDSTPVPDTLNLTGFRSPSSDTTSMPGDLRFLPPGFHTLPDRNALTVAHISEHRDQRLALVFEGEQVRDLSLVFGLAPLAFLLALVYLGAWWSYRATKRAVSPIERLAGAVNQLDLEHPDPDTFSVEHFGARSDVEVEDLAGALKGLAKRVNNFVERERSFTRDASHELRSPLTVIRMAADLLLAQPSLDESSRKAVTRIKRAATDMVELVEAFLLLARESELGVEFEWVCVNDVIQGEVERTRLLPIAADVQIHYREDARMMVETSDKVLSSLAGNLMRNAVAYTGVGDVHVRVEHNAIHIEDSGPGMDSNDLDHAFEAFYRGRNTGRQSRSGYGVGLTIVRRLSERFAWPVEISSAPGEGTCVTVRFPNAQPTGATD